MEFLVELGVTSTGLFSICASLLFPVLLCCGEFCCVVSVVLRCIVLRSVVLCLLCCIALRCVATRCVAVVLYLLSCVAL